MPFRRLATTADGPIVIGDTAFSDADVHGKPSSWTELAEAMTSLRPDQIADGAYQAPGGPRFLGTQHRSTS